MRRTTRAVLLASATLTAVSGIAQANTLSEATAEDPIELTMYYPIAVGGPLENVMDSLIAGFEEKHPHIEVEAVYSGNYTETMVSVQSAIDAGDPPATSVLGGPDMYDLIADDVIAPFDAVVETEAEQAWLDSFYDAFMANSRDAEGRTWGIPFQRSTVVQYWNKEAFAEAGLDPDKPPQDWEELRQIASQVQEESDVSWGVQVPSTSFGYWLFQALAIQAGAELWNEAGTKTYFDAPGSVDALSYWVSLQDDGVHPPGAVDWGTTPQDFLQEETAIIWTTTGNLGNVRKNADFDFGVAQLPAHERRGSPTGGGNFYLFADAPEAERRAAMELIRYMTAPDQAAEWSIATGYVAPTPAAWETEKMQEYVAEVPQATAARDQLAHAVRPLGTYERAQVQDLLTNAVQAALTGEAEPAAALEEAQAAADRLLAPYR